MVVGFFFLFVWFFPFCFCFIAVLVLFVFVLFSLSRKGFFVFPWLSCYLSTRLASDSRNLPASASPGPLSCFFWDTVSLHSPCCPWTHDCSTSVHGYWNYDQAVPCLACPLLIFYLGPISFGCCLVFMLPLTGGSWLCSFWTSVALAAVQGRAGSICWNLAINCLGGDGEWVEHARGRSVGHPPSSAVPARRQLLALLDSWQSVVCCLLAGHVNPIWGGWMMKLLSDHLWVLFPPSHSHFTYFLRLALCGPRLAIFLS